ncbi:MAG: hypothetical protein IJ489_09735 [Clostridia bacterium]|nr:hypothetical protein [Clostridia bacterium]
MNQTLSIWLCSAGIAVCYLFAYTVVFYFSRLSLTDKGKWRDGIFYLDADADSLEYDLRVALAANGFQRTDIVVMIPRDDAKRREMTETVHMMRRQYQNIFYQFI